MLRLLKGGGRILIGDILEPFHQDAKASYKKASSKGKVWWPRSLDHDLTKLYLARNFFKKFAKKNNLKCAFYEQKITGRSIPTPRYDVILDLK